MHRPSTRTTTRTTAALLGTALALTMTATTGQASPSPEPRDTPSSQGAERRAQLAEDHGPRRWGHDRGHGRDRVPGKERQALERLAGSLVDDGAVGVVAQVRRPGPDLWADAGTRRHGRDREVRRDDDFRVASNTKMMISVLVMQEVESGRWSLGTTVDEVLPGLLPGHGDVTVEELLSHTSGLQTGTEISVAKRMTGTTWADYFDAAGADYDDAGLVADAAGQEWGPRGDFLYSNAGYVALGMMLEEATGRDVADLLERRVFAPARMGDTDFVDGPGVGKRSLVGAASTSEGWYSLDGLNLEIFSSAGAVTSTTKDLNRFTRALVDGTLLDSATVQEMTRPRSPEMQYGLGVYLVPDPCTPEGSPQQHLVGHDGGSLGTLSMAMTSLDGERQMSWAVTGRHYSDTDPFAPMPYDLGGFAQTVLAAGC